MIPLVLDFESYYDKDYSVAKMPTMQYVRDPRFRALGAALGVAGGPTRWVPGDDLPRVLAALPWDRIELVAHNAAFDGAILTQRYGHRPARYACTMSMIYWLVQNGHLDAEQTASLKACAPLVGMEKGDLAASLEDGTLDAYATLDGEICAALYRKYYALLPEEERDYISIHVQMSCDPGFILDMDRLRGIARQDEAYEKLFPAVRKDDTFAAMLAKLGVSPKYKTTAKGSYKLATSKTDGWLESLLDHEDARVRKLAEVRAKASSTIERTRARRFLDVGSPFPAPAQYHAAHTGRGGGRDNLNVLNLPRKDGLRQCLQAPEGHKLVIVDSAQIEVRVLAWLAGEERLLDIFRRGEDPYVDFAVTSLYPGSWASVEEMQHWLDKAKAARKAADAIPERGLDAENDRQKAKAAVLALGFGQGAGGFVGYCERNGIPMEPEEAARIVSAYRGTFTRISGGDAPPWRTRRGLWWECEQEVKQTGRQVLPSGRQLAYPELSIMPKGMEYRRAALFRKAKSEGPTNLWHGLATENCLALGTLVCTDAGWLPLADVTPSHRVWDGEEWVANEGLTTPRIQNTIHIEGVTLTPDHEVWTDDGWQPAAASEGFARADVPLADTGGLFGQRRAALAMALQMRLRELQDRTIYKLSEWRREALRFAGLLPPLPLGSDGGALRYARHDSASGICSVAQHVGTVYAPVTSGLEKLRRAGDQSLSGLGGRFRELLAGYGAILPKGAVLGSHRQFARLRAVKLPVGYAPPTGAQHPRKPGDRYARGANAGSGRGTGVGRRGDDAVLPDWGRVAAGTTVRQASIRQQVADLKNCGPRHRFVVCAPGGRPFLVHNCVQAAARDVVFWQTRELWRAGWRVVLSVYDEAVLLVPDEMADEAAEAAKIAFATAPPFMQGLPTAGEVHVQQEYGK